jgi:hypothetical protein
MAFLILRSAVILVERIVMGPGTIALMICGYTQEENSEINGIIASESSTVQT